jgi:hypothetical protein
MKAYLVLITWPDGTEGLLFPRPGNVPVADTEEKGVHDFHLAAQHLREYGLAFPWSEKVGCTIRLVEFERGPTLREFKML